MIGQGGVKLDGTVVTELDVPRAAARRLASCRPGKRRFVRYPAES